MLRIVLFPLLAMLTFGATAQGPMKKPPLPPGRDPGGVAIALITTGIDYTAPHVARGVARDGEGELIGFDLVDNDNRPFGNAGDTRLAITLLDQQIGARLIPVRADTSDPISMARAAAFIAHTPARIAVLPASSMHKEDWEPFRKAVEHLPQILFIAAAGDDGRDLDKEPTYPAAFGLANVLVVTAAGLQEGQSPTIGMLPRANWGANTVDAVALADDSVLASVVAAKAAAATLAPASKPTGAELKQKLIKSALRQREEETPRRTRSLAVMTPVVVRSRMDPVDRILDKARIPERLETR